MSMSMFQLTGFPKISQVVLISMPLNCISSVLLCASKEAETSSSFSIIIFFFRGHIRFRKPTLKDPSADVKN